MKTEAFRAGEGFVSRIRLENIKSCTDWPTRGSRLVFVQMTAAFQARRGCDACTYWLKEIDATLAVDMRHAAPLTQQPACGMATRRRSKAKAKAEPSGSGSGFAVRSDQRPLTPRTPRTVALRPFQHRSPRCRSRRRPQGLQRVRLPTRSVHFARCRLTGCR